MTFQPTRRNAMRHCFCLPLAFVFLIACASMAGAHGGLTVGAFSLPKMNGYRAEVTERPAATRHLVLKGKPFTYRMPYHKEVTYRRTVKADNVELTVSVMRFDQTVTEKSVIAGMGLANSVISRVTPHTGKAAVPDDEVVGAGPLKFGPHDGYRTQTKRHRVRGTKEGEEETRVFWTGKNLYTVGVYVVGQNLSPDARRVAMRDYRALVQHLQHAATTRNVRFTKPVSQARPSPS